MSGNRSFKWIASVALVVVAMVATSLTAVTNAGGAPSVRGINGKTITVAGIGIAQQFANAPIGAQARFKRANDTNELHGYKIKFTEFVDDKQDPATTLSEVRRLVTQEQVFAIVPDVSQSNPGDYLNQQHVPYFGWAFDNTYCSGDKPSDKLYGFGFDGCIVPSNPNRMPDAGLGFYKYVSKKTGKQHPTLAAFSNDTGSGHNGLKYQSSAYQGVGFDVVYSKAVIPPPPVGDYSPYVQQFLKADNGQQPDSILCLLQTDCFPIYNLLQAQGFKGTFLTFLYSDLTLKLLQGSVSQANYVPLDQDTAGVRQLKADVEAFKPGATIDGAAATAYFSADMFIQALKKAGKNPTPESVQKAAAHQTWQIKGLAGPTKYPQSTVRATPACTSTLVADPTQWTQVVPYTCSSKTYPILPKFNG